jgi:hypothetical protein
MAASRRPFRPLGAALLAVLLLLPFAFSGHDHGGDPAASRACGACIAVRHTPSLGPAVAVGCAPRVVEVAFHTAVASVSSATPRPRRHGRAPPAPVLVALV